MSSRVVGFQQEHIPFSFRSFFPGNNSSNSSESSFGYRNNQHVSLPAYGFTRTRYNFQEHRRYNSPKHVFVSGFLIHFCALTQNESLAWIIALTFLWRQHMPDDRTTRSKTTTRVMFTSAQLVPRTTARKALKTRLHHYQQQKIPTFSLQHNWNTSVMS